MFLGASDCCDSLWGLGTLLESRFLDVFARYPPKVNIPVPTAYATSQVQKRVRYRMYRDRHSTGVAKRLGARVEKLSCFDHTTQKINSRLQL